MIIILIIEYLKKNGQNYIKNKLKKVELKTQNAILTADLFIRSCLAYSA